MPAGGLPGIDAEPPRVIDRPAVSLDYRNIPEADVKVYLLDLMRLVPHPGNLDGTAGTDPGVGITPLVETTVKLGDGRDFEDKIRAIDLPLPKEGAYLVMIRGETLYASGIVLVSPLELEVLEEADAGRVRVTVRDAGTKDPVRKVSVKVIGTENPAFLSGETDLRGVFVAEGVRGQVTAVARRDAAQYAFYRGTTHVGTPSAPNAAPRGDVNRPAEPTSEAAGVDNDLGKNIKTLNFDNSMMQIQRLENRYKANPAGVNPGGMPMPAPVPQP